MQSQSNKYSYVFKRNTRDIVDSVCMSSSPTNSANYSYSFTYYQTLMLLCITLLSPVKLFRCVTCLVKNPTEVTLHQPNVATVKTLALVITETAKS